MWTRIEGARVEGTHPRGRREDGAPDGSTAGNSSCGYCFMAVNLAVVSASRSCDAKVRVLPSADTVMRVTLIGLPSRLSVSSTVFASMRLTETLVTPGSPLYGASVPSSFAV